MMMRGSRHGLAAPIGAQGIRQRLGDPTRRWAWLALATVAAMCFAAMGRYAMDVAWPPGGMLHMAAEPGHDAPGAHAGQPATIVRPVACAKLPNVLGKSLTTVIVDFPPGAYTPRHRHPGFVTAFVLTGTVRSQLAGGPVGAYSPGQTWFEPPGTIHLFAENASATEPASLLAIFVADDDCGPLTIFE